MTTRRRRRDGSSGRCATNAKLPSSFVGKCSNPLWSLAVDRLVGLSWSNTILRSIIGSLQGERLASRVNESKESISVSAGKNVLENRVYGSDIEAQAKRLCYLL